MYAINSRSKIFAFMALKKLMQEEAKESQHKPFTAKKRQSRKNIYIVPYKIEYIRFILT